MKKSATNQDITWRSRAKSLRNVASLLSSVWEVNRALTIAAVSLRFVRAVVPLSMLWISKLIIDAIVSAVYHHGGTATMIWKFVFFEFLMAAVSDASARVSTLCESLLSDQLTHHMSTRLMQHACELDLASLEDPLVQERLERARDQATGRLSLFGYLLSLCQETCTLVLLLLGLVVYSPWLIAFVAVAVVPSFLCDTHFSALRYSLVVRCTAWRRQLDYLRFLGASEQTAKEVKLFGLGDYLTERYASTSRSIYNENRALALGRVRAGSLWNTISDAAYYLAYVVVLKGTLSGAISIGALTFLAGSFSRSRSSLQRMSSYLNNISEHAIFLTDLFEFLSMRPSIISVSNGKHVNNPVVSGFEFRDVSFGYPDTNRLVLRNVTLRICPSEKVALIGQNGAGKTTLVKLLLRLYEPTSGAILLDGVDLRDYDLTDLRKHIAVIFQDFIRYDLSVRENLGFGNIGSITDNASLQEAARKSDADDFIERLPRRYDQMIGRRFENGVDLSGGEWQKIALSRMFMRDARLIILDEPTAHLDVLSDCAMMRHFSELAKDRMAVLISHKFSTARMADKILVLEGGSIREQGTHHDLTALKGRYAELFDLQAAGYR